MNTANKRFSTISLALPLGRVPPVPDGSISQTDRAHWLLSYALAFAVAGGAAEFITLGIGTPSSIETFVLTGLFPNQPATQLNTLANAVLDSKPIGYWRLGETAGTTAADATSHMHDGTYVNTPTLGVAGLTGDGGKATTFNGTDERVDLGNVPALRPGRVSVECLLLLSALPGAIKYIGGTGDIGNAGYLLYITAANKVAFVVGNGASSATVESAVLSTATVYHIVGTYNRRVATLYINGVSVASAPLTSIIDYTGITETRIGQAHTINGARYFAGTLAEFAIYDRALHALVVEKHANSRLVAANGQAPLFARANVMRANATRADYFREQLVVTIGGTSVGHKLRKGKTKVTRVLYDQPDRAALETFDITPQVGQEVIIGNGAIDNRLFGGVIVDRRQVSVKASGGTPVKSFWAVTCADWLWDLADRRVLKRYPRQPAHFIARDLATEFAPGYSTARIKSGAPEVEIEFGLDTTVPAAFQQLAARANWNFDVDPYKRILFFDTQPGVAQPVPITPANLKYDLLQYQQAIAQIRTRALVEGGGGVTTAAVAAGATSIPVDECGWYTPGACDVLAGPQRVTFTGRSADSGPGLLTGIPAAGAGSILHDIPEGQNVNILVERNDAAKQAALEALRGAGKGIREYFVRDNRLGVTACQNKGDAELALLGSPIDAGQYESSDKLIDAGRIATIQLPGRGLSLTPVINEVDIWFDSPNRTRRVARFTSAVKIDLADIVRSIGNTQG